MTNPNDPSDRFKVISFTKAAGFDPQTNPVFDLTIKTFPGLGYRVERQQDLGVTFESLGDVIAADDFTKTVQVLLMPGKDFVRVRREWERKEPRLASRCSRGGEATKVASPWGQRVNSWS